jgi:hypothetical protein
VPGLQVVHTSTHLPLVGTHSHATRKASKCPLAIYSGKEKMDEGSTRDREVWDMGW